MMNERYQDYLLRSYEGRVRNNRSYSLRAYARDLKLSSGRLSDILNGHSGLSHRKAAEISSRLGLNPAEQNRFCQLVLAADGRSKKTRKEALELLSTESSVTSAALELEVEKFRVISDWYPFAILELTMLKNFQSDSNWIAKKLGISVIETEQALKRLEMLGLMDMQDNRWKQTAADIATSNDVSSAALREYHRQLLEKAKVSLESQDVMERDVSGLTVSIPEDMLPDIKKRIRAFRKELNTYIESSSKPRDHVYQLGVQFFRLSAKEG